MIDEAIPARLFEALWRELPPNKPLELPTTRVAAREHTCGQSHPQNRQGGLAQPAAPLGCAIAA